MKKKNYKELLFFLLICLSNPILFFDNLEPMDYSWALFFFTTGMFFLRKKYFEVAILMLGISIGTRLNFGLFVKFYNLLNKKRYIKKNTFFTMNLKERGITVGDLLILIIIIITSSILFKTFNKDKESSLKLNNQLEVINNDNLKSKIHIKYLIV